MDLGRIGEDEHPMRVSAIEDFSGKVRTVAAMMRGIGDVPER